jgi:hypothetical protein
MRNVTAVFPDGYQVTARTWMELEDELRRDPWNPSKHEAFRREMRQRAINWSELYVRTDKSSEDFLRGLEQAGMLRLEVER